MNPPMTIPEKMKDTWMRILPIPILLFGAVVAWGIANDRSAPLISEPTSILRTLQVIVISPEEVVVTVRSQGVVKPVKEVELVSQTSGLIHSVADQFVVGGYFDKGELLLRLDPTDAQIALAVVEAEVDKIETELQLSQLKLQRIRKLETEGFANPAQLEDAEYQYRIDLARRAGVKASLMEARREIKRTEVRAPFSGKIYSKVADVGQFVQRGTNLGRIYASKTFQVRLPVSTSDLKFIALPHSDVASETAGSRVELRASTGDQNMKWHGEVVRVEGALSEPGRMVYVVVHLDDQEKKIRESLHMPLSL